MELTQVNKVRLCALAFFTGGAIGGALEAFWNLISGHGLAWTSGLVFFPLCKPVYGLGAALLALFALHEKRFTVRMIFTFIIMAVLETASSLAGIVFFGMDSLIYSDCLLDMDLLHLIFFTASALCFVHFLLPRLATLLARKEEECALVLELLIPLYALALTASLVFLMGPTGVCIPQSLMSFFYPWTVML